MSEKRAPRKRKEVPLDSNGIVNPNHYTRFLSKDRPSAKYRKYPDAEDNWQHMYFPRFMYKNRSLAHHLYGESGFNGNNESLLSIFRGLPYNQIKLPYYQHSHYHDVYQDSVPPPEIESLEAFVRESAVLTSLGAASLARINLQTHQEDDGYHRPLDRLYAQDQSSLIQEIGAIEVMPRAIVASVLVKMATKFPESTLTEFTGLYTEKEPLILPIRVCSTEYLTSIANRRYRSVPYPTG